MTVRNISIISLSLLSDWMEKPNYFAVVLHHVNVNLTIFRLDDSIPEGVDIVSLIFVLSAIHPDKFLHVLCSIAAVLKSGGLLVFRDYVIMGLI